MLVEQQSTRFSGSCIEAATRDWLRDRLAAPRDESARLHGDVLDRPEVASLEAIAASVLVPIVDRPAGLTVLLTQRAAHLADHAGQVSFPGGRAEPEDADAVDTALREAEEEIGLARRHVEIIGRLPDYWTITGYRVTPVVGWVEPPFSLDLDSFEVADAFEVPLEFLMDPTRHERHSYEYNGGRRHYFAMPYEGRHIWGATAAILVNLHRILSC